MRALFWLYHVVYMGCCWCADPQIQRENMSSGSLITNIQSIDNYSEVPWLVAMPGNCQGIVLTPWLILSTATCLKKSKQSHMDISGVNDPESIPHGQRICLYPKFDTSNEYDSIKADIGLLILEQPIYKDDIPLIQDHNISLKSCSKCQYRSCEVYDYQSSKKLGTTSVKKISVQLLDFSICHHQHFYLEKNEAVCVQSQPRKDCWIQQASPVFCFLKNHWELLGLIHKTSRICQNPTVVIRTSPYVTRMKRFIKASKKLLSPTSPLQCRPLQENEHVLKIKHGHTYQPTVASYNSSTQFLQENSSISPQIKHINKFTTPDNFTHTHSFTGDHRLHLEKIHTPQADKFLVKQMKIFPVSELLETTENNLVQYPQDIDTPLSKTSELVSAATASLTLPISDTTTSNTYPEDSTATPWDFSVDNAEDSFESIMDNIIKQWRSPVDELVKTTSAPDINSTGKIWTDTTVNLDAYKNLLGDFTNNSRIQYITKATNPPPKFLLSEKEGPWDFFPNSITVNKSILPFNVPVMKKTLEQSPAESIRVPQPSGTNEPSLSSSTYNVLSSQDQTVSNLVRSQNYPIVQMDRSQVLPLVNIVQEDTEITHEHLPTDYEAKLSAYQLQLSTISSQDQSLLKALIHPISDTEQ